MDKNGYKLTGGGTRGARRNSHGDPLKAKKITGIRSDVDVITGCRMGPGINRMKNRLPPIV